MDTTDPKIVFDEAGHCNHCRGYEQRVVAIRMTPELRERKLQALLEAIKEAGRGKEYDSILGLSGGADSSYIAYLAKQYGLRPLVVHLDNGWDSELAVKNIENIIRCTGFDYWNYVVDWEEFKDLQLAYFKASVVDIEVVTDHAILALIYQAAKKYDIKYILSGENHATEAIMPHGTWNFSGKGDLVNLSAIHARYGTRKLRTYPRIGLYELMYLKEVKNIRKACFIDFIDYHRDEVVEILKRAFGWRDYGAKHGESVFTRFYQGYILPRKFNVDKRRAHYSNMICSGQITREEALRRLESPVYTPDELEEAYAYVVKKLDLVPEAFEALMALPTRSHEEFPRHEWTRLMKVKLALWHALWGAVYRARSGVSPGVVRAREIPEEAV